MEPNKKKKLEEAFKNIVRKIYALKAEKELKAIEERSKEAKKSDELHKKKLDEMENEHIEQMKDLLEGFDCK